MARKTVPAYVAAARAFILARRAKNEAVRIESKAQKDCAKSMHEHHLKSFAFTVDIETGQTLNYEASLERLQDTKVNPNKLYGLVRNNEISLDDFLSLCTISKGAVENFLGEAQAQRVIDEYTKPLALVVKPKANA